MAFKAVTRHKIKLRDPLLDYSDVGPGLYEDEDVIKLDTGEMVAVSVVSRRIPTTGGVEVVGWSRLINSDGSTVLDNAQQEIENEYRHGFSAADVAEHGVDYLARQVMLMLIGEDLDDPRDENDIHMGPLKPSRDLMMNVSIRNDIAVHRQSSSSTKKGALSLLQLKKG